LVVTEDHIFVKSAS